MKLRLQQNVHFPFNTNFVHKDRVQKIMKLFLLSFYTMMTHFLFKFGTFDLMGTFTSIQKAIREPVRFLLYRFSP